MSTLPTYPLYRLTRTPLRCPDPTVRHDGIRIETRCTCGEPWAYHGGADASIPDGTAVDMLLMYERRGGLHTCVKCGERLMFAELVREPCAADEAPPVSPERLRALERLAHAVKVWHRKSAESRALSHELSLKVEATMARTEITAALVELERHPA